MMKKINKKTRGFTLLELIISLVIFTLVVVGTYSSMFGLFKNTSKEREVTENVYQGQSDIEKISSLIRTAKETIRIISSEAKTGEKSLKSTVSILPNQDAVLDSLYDKVNDFVKLKMNEINESDIDDVISKIEDVKQDVANLTETDDNKFIIKKFDDTLSSLLGHFKTMKKLSNDAESFINDKECSIDSATLTVFDTTSYKAEVKGYQIYKPIKGRFQEKLVNFIAYEDIDLKQIPQFDGKPYIINYSLKQDKLLNESELKNYDYNEVEFVYANPDYINDRLDGIRAVFKEDVHMGIKGKYLINDRTKRFSYYEMFEWFKSKKEYGVEVDNAGVITMVKRTVEPVFRSQNENKIPEGALDNFYPTSDHAFTKATNNGKVLSSNYLKNDLGEGYVKLKVTPVSVTGVKTEAKETSLLWLIGLPITRDLYYHYDCSMDGSYLPKYDGTGAQPSTEVDYLRDLTTVYTIADKASANDMIKKMEKDSGKITLYKDKDYGKYIELGDSSSEAFKIKDFRQIQDKPKQFRNKVTLILVLDLDNAKSGTILKKSNVKFSGKDYQCYQLDYDKTRRELTFWSGANKWKNKNSVKQKINGTGKHIVIMTAKNVIYPKNGRLNSLAVDSWDFKSEFHDKFRWIHNKKKEIDLNMWDGNNENAVLEIGGDDASPGAKGAKLYEIIAYTDILQTRDDVADPPLYHKELPYVLDYLKEKYHIN